MYRFMHDNIITASFRILRHKHKHGVNNLNRKKKLKKYYYNYNRATGSDDGRVFESSYGVKIL